MVDDPLAPLHAAHRRSQVQGLFVAALSGGLGAFMIALHALGLDPDAARLGTAALVALYGFATLFLLTAIGLVWVALFRSRNDIAELKRRLTESPAQIARARRQVATRRTVQPAASETAFGAHQAHIEGTDGRTFVLNASPAQVSDVLRMVRERCPEAEVTGLG